MPLALIPLAAWAPLPAHVILDALDGHAEAADAVDRYFREVTQGGAWTLASDEERAEINDLARRLEAARVPEKEDGR